MAGALVLGAAGLGATGRAMAARDTIEVRAPAGAIHGVLRFGGLSYPCAVGRSGIVAPKHEGDGGTPAGLFALREVRYRPDRIPGPPKTGLPLYPTRPNDGWCDDPADPDYNRLVALPHQSDAEEMWLKGGAYDLLAVIGYNDAPTVPGAGSAVFLHVAHEDGGAFGATAGCVSLRLADLEAVLAGCGPGAMIDIRTGG